LVGFDNPSGSISAPKLPAKEGAEARFVANIFLYPAISLTLRISADVVAMSECPIRRVRGRPPPQPTNWVHAVSAPYSATEKKITFDIVCR
jgi:hypothetical protein